MNRIHRIWFVQLRAAAKVSPAGGWGRGCRIWPDGGHRRPGLLPGTDAEGQ